MPNCTKTIKQIFVDTNYLHNLVTNLHMDHNITKKIIKNPQITNITLTNSTQTKQTITTIANHTLKKTILELGENNPYVILDDTDLNTTMETYMHNHLINNSQNCITTKHFLVTEKNHDAFVTHIMALMKDKTMDDPMDKKTNIKPQAHEDLQNNLHTQVKKNIKTNTKYELDNEIPDHPNFFYPPTILTNMKKNMPAFDEELFNPVTTMIHYHNKKKTITLTNDTPFRLNTTMFTTNMAHNQKITETQLHTNCYFVNTFMKNDPRLPFNNVGQSNYDHELTRQNILEFVNTKTIYIT